MATTTSERTEKGVSLARGPALILGTILEVAGLYFLYKQHGFPKFANFPNGNVPAPGKVFFGIFGVNGWSGLLTAAAGGLLLFGAAQHLLAKTMSLIVGVALGAAAVIAVISGNVLGLAAANAWTRLGWGVCAVILLFNAMIPRRTRTIEEPVAAGGRPVGRRPVAAGRTAEPVTRTGAAETEPMAARDREGAVADHERDTTALNHERDTTALNHEGDTAQPATEATRVQRAGPLDERDPAVDQPAGETAAGTPRREPPPE